MMIPHPDSVQVGLDVWINEGGALAAPLATPAQVPKPSRPVTAKVRRLPRRGAVPC